MSNCYSSSHESCEKFFAEDARKAAERRANFFEEEARIAADTRALFFIAEAIKAEEAAEEEKYRKVQEEEERRSGRGRWRMSARRDMDPQEWEDQFDWEVDDVFPISPSHYRTSVEWELIRMGAAEQAVSYMEEAEDWSEAHGGERSDAHDRRSSVGDPDWESAVKQAKFFRAEARKAEKHRKAEELREAEDWITGGMVSGAFDLLPLAFRTSFTEPASRSRATDFPEPMLSSDWTPIPLKAEFGMFSLVDSNAPPPVTPGRAASPENPSSIPNSPSRTSVAQDWLSQWSPRSGSSTAQQATAACHTSGMQNQAATKAPGEQRMSCPSVEAADSDQSGGETEDGR
jgi:hypothetical protein